MKQREEQVLFGNLDMGEMGVWSWPLPCGMGRDSTGDSRAAIPNGACIISV